MNKLLVLLAALIGGATLAFSVGASSTATAKLVGEDKVTVIGPWAVNEHFVYQNITDGDANGMLNQRNYDCTGDRGTIAIRAGKSKPKLFPIICAHYVAGTHLTMNFAFQTGTNEWTMIRWLGTKNKMAFTDNQLCAIGYVNMGPQTAGAVCNGHINQTFYRSKGSAHVILH